MINSPTATHTNESKFAIPSAAINRVDLFINKYICFKLIKLNKQLYSRLCMSSVSAKMTVCRIKVGRAPLLDDLYNVFEMMLKHGVK